MTNLHGSRRRRILLGLTGLLVGLAGITRVVIDRQEAEKRRELFRQQAASFRDFDQRRHDRVPAGAVTFEGRTFRPNDRVQIAKWAGTLKPADTGAEVEVDADRGRTGVVIRGERRTSTASMRFDLDEPVQIVRVRWASQKWKVNGKDQLIDLPEFETTIHVSYLELVR